MRGCSIGVLLGWLGYVRGVLLSIDGHSHMKMSRYLVDVPKAPVNTRVNVVGRRLLQTNLPAQCAVVGNRCGCIASISVPYASNQWDDFTWPSKSVDNDLNTYWKSIQPSTANWWQTETGTGNRDIIGGIITAASSPSQLGYFEVWVGETLNEDPNSITTITTTGTMCYRSNSSEVVFEAFSCLATTKIISIIRPTQNDFMVIDEVKFYLNSGKFNEVVSGNTCVCPPGTSYQDNICTCQVAGQSLVGGVCVFPVLQCPVNAYIASDVNDTTALSSVQFTCGDIQCIPSVSNGYTFVNSAVLTTFARIGELSGWPTGLGLEGL